MNWHCNVCGVFNYQGTTCCSNCKSSHQSDDEHKNGW